MPSDGFEHKDTTLLINTLTTNPTKWSNTLKQFVGCWPMSVFDHFVGLALKGLYKLLLQIV